MLELIYAKLNISLSGQAMLSERITSVISEQEAIHNRIEDLRESMTPIIRHCERLMREKETLRKIHEENRLAATPTLMRIAVGECAFSRTHRMGIRCGVCGHTPSERDAP
jgi:hypothetical protein